MDEKIVDELGLTKDDYIDVTPASTCWLSMDDLPNEIWKDINDFNGKYKISNYGRVKSEYLGGHILKQGKNSNGYWLVILSKDGVSYTRKVHRLVANAFMNTSNKDLVVDHIKSVTEQECNNKLINLRMVTLKENVQHSIRCGRFKNPPLYKKCGINHHSSKPVAQYTLNGIFIRNFECLDDAIRYLNKQSASNISNCCKGITKQAYGYKWKFIERETIRNENSNK